MGLVLLDYGIVSDVDVSKSCVLLGRLLLAHLHLSVSAMFPVFEDCTHHGTVGRFLLIFACVTYSKYTRITTMS